MGAKYQGIIFLYLSVSTLACYSNNVGTICKSDQCASESTGRTGSISDSSRLDTAEPFINALETGRIYEVVEGKAPLWTEYAGEVNGVASLLTVKVAQAHHVNLMNGNLQTQLATKNYQTLQDISAVMPNLINTSRWMDQLWEYIKSMPANQVIFPGTHDTLTGYPATTIFKNDRSELQENQTLTQQLNAGCRFFDLRLVGNWLISKRRWPDIQTYEGVHSGVIFKIRLEGIVQELANFYADGRKDIIIIKLGLFQKSDIFGSAKKSSDSEFRKFINYVRSNNILSDKIIKSGRANSTLEQLAAEGRIIFLADTSDLNAGNNNEYFWRNDVFFNDAVSGSWPTETTPIEWYNAIMKLGYASGALRSDNVFSYLSMTQTNGSSPKKITDSFNGPLADWLLYATPDVPAEDRIAVPAGIDLNLAGNVFNNHGGAFVLPYKQYYSTQPTFKSERGRTVVDNPGLLKTMKNYNLIAMDYYNKSPFVINAITQNLKVSRKFLAN